MALGERFRSGGAHGIAQFLADHQHCDAGFDVRRDEGIGSGRLTITCDGCGQHIDYRAADAGELAAALPAAVGENGDSLQRIAPEAVGPPPGPIGPAAAAPANAPPPGMRRVVTPPPPEKGFRIPGWVSVALIGALIIGGMTMIAIGVITQDEEPTSAPTPPAPAPAKNQQQGQQPERERPQPEQQAENQRQQREPSPAGERPGNSDPPAGAAEGALRRQTFANRLRVGVPRGWENGVEDGAITLTPPGSAAQLSFFFEPGERPPAQLGRAAAGFLAQRHGGAQVEAPQRFRLGPHRALRIVATYQGGEEVAVVLSANGFTHLVLRRVDRGATPDLEQQADAALASFRPA